MATTTETLGQEYNRLLGEQAQLSAAARRTGSISPQDKQRHSEVTRRIREILTTPPQGYELPKLAADLVAHAEAHGWLSLVQWTPPDYPGEPFVSVQVGRRLQEGEMPDARGDKWVYKLTWHSRGCAVGKVRLFVRGTAATPDSPADSDAPSVKEIRAVIAANPVQGEREGAAA